MAKVIEFYGESEIFARYHSGSSKGNGVNKCVHRINEQEIFFLSDRPYLERPSFTNGYNDLREFGYLNSQSALEFKLSSDRAGLGWNEHLNFNLKEDGIENKFSKWSGCDPEIFKNGIHFGGTDSIAVPIKGDGHIRCWYCQSIMVENSQFPEHNWAEDEPNTPDTVWYKRYSRKSSFRCFHCGWWCVEREQYESMRASDCSGMYRLESGTIKTFDIDSTEVPISALRRHLTRHGKDLSDIHPTAFEKLVADIFRDIYGPTEVVHVGGSNDRGIDIKILSNGQVSCLVQVKRRSNLDRSEGVRVVRELNGVLLREGIKKGIVVTTASDFTKAAREEASPSRHGFSPLHRTNVDLIDYQALSQLLGDAPIHNTRVWTHCVSKPVYDDGRESDG